MNAESYSACSRDFTQHWVSACVFRTHDLCFPPLLMQIELFLDVKFTLLGSFSCLERNLNFFQFWRWIFFDPSLQISWEGIRIFWARSPGSPYWSLLRIFLSRLDRVFGDQIDLDVECSRIGSSKIQIHKQWELSQRTKLKKYHPQTFAGAEKNSVQPTMRSYD